MNKRALTLFLFLIASCTRGEESGRLQIAVIPKGTSHEYWKSVHAGAEAAARELGVEVLWKGPLLESDINAQIQVVEDFVTRGVDGIVLMPLHEVALVRSVEDAQQAGVPVIIADSDLDWADRISYVATDNERGGEMGGEQLAQLLGGKGKVILMRYTVGSESTTKREEGFLKAMAANPGIEIVSSNQYAGATIEGAQETAENLLNAFAEVDGIFCPCEPAAYGMMRAIQDAGRKDEIKFVGFDSSDKLVTGLEEGQVDALVLQSPVAIGNLSVRAMVKHLRGETVEGRIDTGVVIATQENMSSPVIKKLLFPDLSILGE